MKLRGHIEYVRPPLMVLKPYVLLLQKKTF